MEIGFWGSGLIKLAFVSTAVSGYAYWQAVRQPVWADAWRRWGRAAWSVSLPVPGSPAGFRRPVT
jgi:hypothetical protein